MSGEAFIYNRPYRPTEDKNFCRMESKLHVSYIVTKHITRVRCYYVYMGLMLLLGAISIFFLILHSSPEIKYFKI